MKAAMGWGLIVGVLFSAGFASGAWLAARDMGLALASPEGVEICRQVLASVR